MKHNLKTYPSCEVCSVAKLPTPAQHCYDARHKYPSECPKDEWMKDFEAELRLKLSSKSTIFENGVETIRKILGESHG